MKNIIISTIIIVALSQVTLVNEKVTEQELQHNICKEMFEMHKQTLFVALRPGSEQHQPERTLEVILEERPQTRGTINNCPLCDSCMRTELFRVGPIVLSKQIPPGSIAEPGHGYRLKEQDVIARCSSCGFIYVNNPDLGLAEFYDSPLYHGGVSDRRVQIARADMECITTYMQANGYPDLSDIMALEVGFGAGHHMKIAKDMGLQIEGLETSQTAMSMAQQDGLRVFNRTLQQHIEEGEGPVDLIMYIATLEHILDAVKQIRLANSILKNNGLIFITRLPNLDSAIGKIQKERYYDIKCGHFFYFNPDTIKKLLEANGFEVVLLETQINDWVHQEFKNGRISRKDYDYLLKNWQQIENDGQGELITVIAKKIHAAKNEKMPPTFSQKLVMGTGSSA